MFFPHQKTTEKIDGSILSPVSGCQFFLCGSHLNFITYIPKRQFTSSVDYRFLFDTEIFYFRMFCGDKVTIRLYGDEYGKRL